MKKDFLAPVLVLSLICLVVSGALAVTNGFTQPVIAESAGQRADGVRNEIIPGADGFVLLEIEGLPASVIEVYKAKNGDGFVFTVVSGGYGGDLKIVVGLDNDGNVIRSKVLEHSETKGLGSKIEDATFSSRFDGLGPEWRGDVDVISGATISSNAYAKAVGDALEAFGVLVS